MTTALYRRYRPETFADVIGQEHVTEPLMQALRTGRVNHAYLFSGPRGCGKTTSARILARCLNCEQGPTPTPCGSCDSCVALARGGAGSVDVIEIDAASHGGVDDARDLRERAAFGPALSRYKVYIIDEAHMVSSQGFNALLKVVEEPPEHVKFIFATTEPDKVIATIRSRTHHYPFHLVPPQRLTAYLEQLCEAEGVALEPGVLSFVTRAGGGSVRDSLSVLDQLISGAGEAGLTYERTAALLGFTDAELLDAVVDAVAAGDAASVFTQVDKVMESGHDPRRFVEDLLERYRDLIVLQAVGERSGGMLRALPEDQLARMRQQASAYGPASLSRCADLVNRGLSEMTGAVSSRLHLELICARLMLPGAAGEQGYGSRLDRIERRLAHGGGAEAPAGSAAPSRPVSRPAPQGDQVYRPDGRTASGPPPGRPQPAGGSPAVAEAPVVPEASAVAPEPTGPTAGQRAAEQRAPEQHAAEQRVPEQRVPEQRPATDQGVAEQRTAPTEPTASPPQAAERPAGSLDTDAVRRAWPDVLDKVKAIRRVTWTLVSVNCSVLDFDGNRLLLGLSTAGLATTFNETAHREVVRQALIEALALDTRVEGVAQDDGGATAAAGARSAPRPEADEPPDDADPRPDGPADGPGPRRSEAGSAGASLAEQLGAPSGRSRPDPAAAPEWSARSGAAPAWATAGAGEPAAGGPVEEAARRPGARSDAHGNGSSGTGGAPPSAPPRKGADEPSEDDEDLETSGAIGQPVIESVLGGTVIAVDDDH